MKMKYTIILLLFSCAAWGQTPCDTTINRNPSRCKWTYFKLDKSIEGAVIVHYKAGAGCGTFAFASLTIVKIDADTIRVLDLCNENLYLVGQKIKISPEDKPPFSVILPETLFLNGIRGAMSKKMKRKIRKGQVKASDIPSTPSHIDEYDKSVLRTTWASISITL
jgi:hypothetical protein